MKNIYRRNPGKKISLRTISVSKEKNQRVFHRRLFQDFFHHLSINQNIVAVGVITIIFSQSENAEMNRNMVDNIIFEGRLGILIILFIRNLTNGDILIFLKGI